MTTEKTIERTPEKGLFYEEWALPVFKSKIGPEVLIVEDDLTYEPIWEDILSRIDERIDFTWAESVPEAEQYLWAQMSGYAQFDLVICDIFLSGTKTGIDLWQKYSKVMDGKLILVSSLDEKKLKKYLGSNSNDFYYIAKPIQYFQAMQTVRTLLKK